MQFHVYKYTLFIILLLYLTYEDIKYKKISIFPTILFFLNCITYSQNHDTFLITSTIIILLYLSQKNKIGEGDIIIISSISNNISLENIGYFFILLGITSSIFIKIYRKKIIPLIPFITFSFLLTKAIEIYL